MAPGASGNRSSDRGRDGGVNATPPSEPDGRVSRIRLSGQWVRSATIVRVHPSNLDEANGQAQAHYSAGSFGCVLRDVSSLACATLLGRFTRFYLWHSGKSPRSEKLSFTWGWRLAWSASCFSFP